jgi:hypothetical protein
MKAIGRILLVIVLASYSSGARAEFVGEVSGGKGHGRKSAPQPERETLIVALSPEAGVETLPREPASLSDEARRQLLAAFKSGGVDPSAAGMEIISYSPKQHWITIRVKAGQGAATRKRIIDAAMPFVRGVELAVSPRRDGQS